MLFWLFFAKIHIFFDVSIDRNKDIMLLFAVTRDDTVNSNARREQITLIKQDKTKPANIQRVTQTKQAAQTHKEKSKWKHAN